MKKTGELNNKKIESAAQELAEIFIAIINSNKQTIKWLEKNIK